MDVHPTYVSVVIKCKLLRLRLPTEVKSSEASCLRSKTTGSLLVTMPKVNAKELIGLVAKSASKESKTAVSKSTAPPTKVMPKKLSMMEEAMLAATAASAQIN